MSLSRHPRLLEPVLLGPLRLPNRMVMGGMHTLLERLDRPTERLVAFYQARAAGGIGLIVTGAHGITSEGRLDPDAAVLDDESTLTEHRAVVDAVHDLGGRIVLQLIHAGRYAKVPDCVSASDRRARINRHTPRRLTTPQVWEVVAAFATSATLARSAGYDGVEIMGAEGYLINEFLAPATNDRNDEFGGDLDGRLRLAVEVVRAVRSALGTDRALLYRISAIDLVDGGMTGAETVELARRVEAAGADALNTGVGWHESGVPTIAAAVPRAAWAFAVRRIRDAVDIPVIAANRINDPDVAEALLDDGTADLVAMARPLLADPDFARKVRLGDPDTIAPCIACNQACLDRMFNDQPVTCMINPAAGRELEFVTAAPVVRRRIAVVGAGPAGMAYAVTAAERGHEVTLHDSASDLGGQWNLARLVPGKTEFNQALRYYRVRLERLGVQLRLGEWVNAADLADGDYDHVVVATGVAPRKPEISGIDHPTVASYGDVLTGAVVPGHRVAIIGAGGIAYDVAEFLLGDEDESTEPDAFARAWGVESGLNSAGGLRSAAISPAAPRHQVTILQRSTARFGSRLGRTTGWILRARLTRNGLREIGGVHYTGIDDDGLSYELDGEPHTLAVDTVIVCAGQEPERSLYDELTTLGLPTTLIGGAYEAAELDAVRAIEQATRAALAV